MIDSALGVKELFPILQEVVGTVDTYLSFFSLTTAPDRRYPVTENSMPAI